MKASRNERKAASELASSVGQVMERVHAVAANSAGMFVLFSKNSMWYPALPLSGSSASLRIWATWAAGARGLYWNSMRPCSSEWTKFSLGGVLPLR